MGVWLRNLFTAPVFEDEDRTRVARLLHVILIIFIVLAGGVTTLLWVFYGIPKSVADAFTPVSGVVVLLVSFFLLFLARQGHNRLAAALLILLIWGAITAWGVFFSGISGENSLLIYPFLIALGGLLLGGPAAMGVMWLCTLGVLASYFAEVWGFVTPAPQQAGPSDLLIALPILFMTGLLLRYAVLSNTRGFARARLREQELRESNEQLAAARAELEQRSGRLQTIVQECVACMAEVARGNLAARVPLAEQAGDDPLLVLGRRLNETIASLQQMTGQLRATAGNLAAASAGILAATTQQASGAGEQSAAIAQASTTIDQVQAIAAQTAQQAEGVVAVAQRTLTVSQAGQQAVVEAIAGMEVVKQRVETISNTILALSEQTQAIGGIIATVGEIAKQSNLLALNAAVEAARAGEAGRSFAVVAGEVRALAERSRAATMQVKELLPLIQNGVNSAVLATEEGIKGAYVGTRLTGESGEAIRRLAEGVAEATRAAEQIAAAAGQQRVDIKQLATTMVNIQQVTAQTLASTQQTEHTAADLNGLAGQLNELVGQYQL